MVDPQKAAWQRVCLRTVTLRIPTPSPKSRSKPYNECRGDQLCSGERDGLLSFFRTRRPPDKWFLGRGVCRTVLLKRKSAASFGYKWEFDRIAAGSGRPSAPEDGLRRRRGPGIKFVGSVHSVTSARDRYRGVASVCSRTERVDLP